jgi:hypothetical protein
MWRVTEPDTDSRPSGSSPEIALLCPLASLPHSPRDRAGRSMPDVHPYGEFGIVRIPTRESVAVKNRRDVRRRVGVECTSGRLPDFIIIGAMKSATTTLHEQLALQPGIFMSRPKEPNFFSDDEIAAKGIDWYRSLFRLADAGDLLGESSTHYSKLPTYPKTIERMRRTLPDVKLIYVMRHPVDRLVSHYLHEAIREFIIEPIDQAIEGHPELISYGCYGMQLVPFLDAYGPDRVFPVFFDRLVENPQQELEQICRFIGYKGDPRWDFTLKAQNVTSEQLRRSMFREMLVNAPILRALHRRLIWKPWREHLKRLWQIEHERPNLSEQALARLRPIFDADLKRLGVWLGTDLDCDRFREVALAGHHHWTDAVGCSTPP